MVVEGLHTAPALAALAREAGVDLPITDAVCSVIARSVDPRGARDAAGARRAGGRVLGGLPPRVWPRQMAHAACAIWHGGGADSPVHES